MTTVRFWDFVNTAPVLIKLRQGQRLAHVSGGPTDEGYSWRATVYAFDGDVVTVETTIQSRDCDGRVDYHQDIVCPVAKLRAGMIDSDFAGVVYPAWQATHSSQRDYSAEAMGY